MQTSCTDGEVYLVAGVAAHRTGDRTGYRIVVQRTGQTGYRRGVGIGGGDHYRGDGAAGTNHLSGVGHIQSHVVVYGDGGNRAGAVAAALLVAYSHLIDMFTHCGRGRCVVRTGGTGDIGEGSAVGRHCPLIFILAAAAVGHYADGGRCRVFTVSGVGAGLSQCQRFSHRDDGDHLLHRSASNSVIHSNAVCVAACCHVGSWGVGGVLGSGDGGKVNAVG